MPKFAAGALLSCLTIACTAQELDTLWRLRVMDLKHQVKVDATIRFGSEVATESCMGGAWRRIVVEEKTAHEEAFFPLSEPLAYELGRGMLTLGRTKVCDGYLFLTGKAGKARINGTFNAVGPGYREKLGYFSLKKVQQHKLNGR